MAFIRAMGAEWLKMRRTLALWLAPLASLVIVALQIAGVLQRESYYRQQQLPDPWGQYAEQTVFLWAILMLPLFITLETALLANLEHSNQQWKHLFALPIPRWAVYAAKQVTAMTLIALSMAALLGYIGLSGLALRGIAPGLGFEAPVPWASLARFVGQTYLASWLILSLHTWVGLRWRSFVVASAVGIGAMVIGVILFGSDWSRWYPWTLPGLIAASLGEGLRPAAEIAVGSLGGLAAAVLGGWDVIRRDVL